METITITKKQLNCFAELQRQTEGGIEYLYIDSEGNLYWDWLQRISLRLTGGFITPEGLPFACHNSELIKNSDQLYNTL